MNLTNGKGYMSTPSSSSPLKSAAGDGISDQFPVGLRILVVDDDPTCLMILERMLKACLYEVTKCKRAEVAWRWLSIIIIILFLISSFLILGVAGVQIISKSKLEKCERNSNSDNLNCTTKIVVKMAVPSGSSGGEASLVAELVEVEENSTTKMQTLRVPHVITVNKSAAYALYELTYIRDVPYKPEEYYVQTRKCEPDASANVVKICESSGWLHHVETSLSALPLSDLKFIRNMELRF